MRNAHDVGGMRASDGSIRVTGRRSTTTTVEVHGVHVAACGGAVLDPILKGDALDVQQHRFAAGGQR